MNFINFLMIVNHTIKPFHRNDSHTTMPIIVMERGKLKVYGVKIARIASLIQVNGSITGNSLHHW